MDHTVSRAVSKNCAGEIYMHVDYSISCNCLSLGKEVCLCKARRVENIMQKDGPVVTPSVAIQKGVTRIFRLTPISRAPLREFT